MKKIFLSAILLTGMVGFAQEPVTTEEDTVKKDDSVEVILEEAPATDETVKENPAIKDESVYGEPKEEEQTIEE